MEEKIIRFGVVGMGRGRRLITDGIGEKHLRLTAICDHDPEKLEQAREHFAGLGITDLQCFDSFDDLLASDIDAVVIATEAIYHVPYVIQALDAGKHVLSEIPAINSIEEARQLKAAVKAHPELKYMTGENCCYWAFIQAWKTMYDEGKFGQAVYAESEYIHCVDYRDIKAEDYPQEHWRSFNPAIKYLTHNLGPLLYIMDDRCVSVSCMSPEVPYNPYVSKYHNGIAIFKTAKGAVIRIFICFDAYAGFDHNFTIYGTRGTIETDRVAGIVDAHSFARFSDIPGSRNKKLEIPVALKFPGEPDSGHGGADKKMLSAFVKCIVEDSTPPIDVDLGINISLPGIIASESALRGGELMQIPQID